VVSVQEGAPALGCSRARRPVVHVPKMVPSDEATPTADLFASLAARGAALVDRQHELLDALQLREEDPQRLAGLFSFDHLAAQLRRNSNAALVLAGLLTIRSIHVPTVLSELASAAVSEVNGYQRVTVGAFPTRRVQAHIASDLVHLLGDLLENALAVSPRTGGVWVRGERPRSAASNAPLLVRVGDSGTGVSEAALENLNDMLAGRAAHIGTGRGVGLVVTREIARRHSLTVQFKRLVSGGLVATVTLPDALFESTGVGTLLTQTDDRIAWMQG
jgi:signal transduction histidine kinase